MEDLCGCGKPVRYVSSEGKGSCNKYARCPTYDDLRDTLGLANRRLGVYQQAINKIDDYFEYSMESKRDQKKVHQLLGNLTDALAETLRG